VLVVLVDKVARVAAMVQVVLLVQTPFFQLLPPQVVDMVRLAAVQEPLVVMGVLEAVAGELVLVAPVLEELEIRQHLLHLQIQTQLKVTTAVMAQVHLITDQAVVVEHPIQEETLPLQLAVMVVMALFQQSQGLL
jgi:hypothetical protein